MFSHTSNSLTPSFNVRVLDETLELRGRPSFNAIQEAISDGTKPRRAVICGTPDELNDLFETLSRANVGLSLELEKVDFIVLGRFEDLTYDDVTSLCLSLDLIRFGLAKSYDLPYTLIIKPTFLAVKSIEHRFDSFEELKEDKSVRFIADAAVVEPLLNKPEVFEPLIQRALAPADISRLILRCVNPHSILRIIEFIRNASNVPSQLEFNLASYSQPTPELAIALERAIASLPESLHCQFSYTYLTGCYGGFEVTQYRDAADFVRSFVNSRCLYP